MWGHSPPFYWDTGENGESQGNLYRWVDSKKCGIIGKALFIHVYFLLFLECVGIELTSLQISNFPVNYSLSLIFLNLKFIKTEIAGIFSLLSESTLKQREAS